MGYQVTITGTDEDTEDGLISREEWLDYCGSDPEMMLQDENENYPNAIWTGPQGPAELCWEEIGVWSWSPEETTILKMIDIAGKFNAPVIGEDGTVFEKRSDGSILEISPDEGPTRTEAPPPVEGGMDRESEDSKPWWKKLFG